MDNHGDERKQANGPSEEQKKRKSKKERTDQVTATKNSVRRSASASVPGAVAEGFGAIEPQPMEPPTRAGSAQGSTFEASGDLGASSYESRAKNRSRRTAPATSPGAVSSDADAAINSLEEDIAAKNRARATPGAMAATGGSQRGKRGSSGRNVAGAIASNQGPQTPTKGSGRRLRASGQQAASNVDARNAAEHQAILSSLEADIYRKNRIMDPTERKAAEVTAFAATAGIVGGMAASAQPPPVEDFTAFKDIEEGFDKRAQENGGDGGTEGAVVEPAQAEAAQEPYHQQARAMGGEGSDDEGEGGIEAYVAEQQVIETLGVSVIPSDEEVEKEEKKKFRRYMTYSILGLLVVAAAIVIPIGVVFGKSEPVAPREPTAMPSAAPSGMPSAAPSTSRFLDTLVWASIISGDALLNQSSPQYLAADWVANNDTLAVTPVGSPQFLQRYVLAVFYFSTGGDKWEECSRFDTCNDDLSWLKGNQTECQWHGIRCDTPDVITRILIGNKAPLGNNLVGTFPVEFAELTSIFAIVLVEGDAGKIRGTIPTQLARLTDLTTIFIQDHALSGTIPQQLLLNTPKMEMFAVGNNRLSGRIPTTLASLTALRDLQLQGNQFTGAIPPIFGTVTTLRNLELSRNLLNGTIPNRLFDLPSVTQWSLDGNQLTGTISNLVGQLLNLEIFEVQDNQLVGNLPETIYSLPELQVIRVSGNRLSGPVSPNFIFLNETLSEFSGYDNDFTGTFPSSTFEKFPDLKSLILHGTNLTGRVSQALCDLKGDTGLVNLTVPTTVDCSVVAFCCNLIA